MTQRQTQEIFELFGAERQAKLGEVQRRSAETAGTWLA